MDIKNEQQIPKLEELKDDYSSQSYHKIIRDSIDNLINLSIKNL